MKNPAISRVIAKIAGTETDGLRKLGLRYSEGCWASGWKTGKVNDLNDHGNPFCGSPEMILSKGITELEDVEGNMISITPLTRIRLRELSDAALEKLGILDLKEGSNPSLDVIHPEFTETFEELIAKSERFLMNNFLAASAVLDTVVSFLVTDSMTVEDLIAMLEGALDGSNAEVATFISLGVRMSWIGRACIDGSWRVSKGYIFFCDLTTDISEIDAYVAQPVIRQFISDLKTVG